MHYSFIINGRASQIDLHFSNLADGPIFWDYLSNSYYIPKFIGNGCSSSYILMLSYEKGMIRQMMERFQFRNKLAKKDSVIMVRVDDSFGHLPKDIQLIMPNKTMDFISIDHAYMISTRSQRTYSYADESNNFTSLDHIKRGVQWFLELENIIVAEFEELGFNALIFNSEQLLNFHIPENPLEGKGIFEAN